MTEMDFPIIEEDRFINTLNGMDWRQYGSDLVNKMRKKHPGKTVHLHVWNGTEGQYEVNIDPSGSSWRPL